MAIYYTEGYIKEISIGQGVNTAPNQGVLCTPSLKITPAAPFIFEEEKTNKIILRRKTAYVHCLTIREAEVSFILAFPLRRAFDSLILLKTNKVKVGLTLERKNKCFKVVGLKVL